MTIIALKDIIFSHTKALTVALSYRDRMTQAHSERVRGLSLEIGMHYGLNQSELTFLSVCASFHDIGKIGIPDHILLKPTSLNDSEWAIITTHSEIGEKILTSTEVDGSREVARIIRNHHEYYDGQGYPDGLLGESIPLCSRVISIADSYDAMAVTRPYRAPIKHEVIMEILQEENGKKHDPQLMSVFQKTIELSEFKACS